MKRKPKLELQLIDGRWYARFYNDPFTVNMYDLDPLPTSFTANVSVDQVVNKMKLLNPLHTIIINQGA